MYIISTNSGSTVSTYESLAVYDEQNRQMAIVIVQKDDGKQKMIGIHITAPSCDKEMVIKAVKEKGWEVNSPYVVVNFPEQNAFFE